MYRTLLRTLRLLNIDCNSEQLKVIPNSVIVASTLLSISAIGQWLVDLSCELLAYFGVLPPIPFRINFITLTFLSALLAYQTFRSLQHNELVITNSALQVALLVETGLIIGDVYFLSNLEYPLASGFLVFFRMPFITLTTINVLLIGYIYLRLRFFKAKASLEQVDTLQGYPKKLHQVVFVPNSKKSPSETEG